MRPLRHFSLCLLATSPSLVFGQGPVLTGIGYVDPSIMRVAPGQITTLFVTGLKTVLASSVSAPGLPLPTTLAGISVTLNQSNIAARQVPLVAVQQLPVCDTGGPAPAATFSADCLITAITVQMPLELAIVGGGGAASFTTELIVAENGNATKAFRVSPQSDNLHIMTTCDVPSPHFVRTSQPVTSSSPSCLPLVTRANGDLVIANDPAKPGEEIVIWAFGLGLTTPPASTGQASPTPAAQLSSLLYLQFDFRVNAGPSRPYMNPLILTPGAPIFTPGPVFAGLTPGLVGLYQINVIVPASIPAIGACTTGASTLPPYNIIQSNLTIDLGATASFDGAAICVKPQ
jgi:uncharacterized protein (TIGR03437 family)